MDDCNACNANYCALVEILHPMCSRMRSEKFWIVSAQKPTICVTCVTIHNTPPLTRMVKPFLRYFVQRYKLPIFVTCVTTLGKP